MHIRKRCVSVPEQSDGWDASHVYQLRRAISLFQEEGCHLLALGFTQVSQAEGKILIY